MEGNWVMIMEKLNDGVHNCEGCSLYPCSTSPSIEGGEICDGCRVNCCSPASVILLPCEVSSGKYKIAFTVKGTEGVGGLLATKRYGECYAHSEDGKCSIYPIRPIVCRVAMCRKIAEAKGFEKVVFIP